MRMWKVMRVVGDKKPMFRKWRGSFPRLCSALLQLVEPFARGEDDDSQALVDVQATQARNGGRLPMLLTLLVVNV